MATTTMDISSTRIRKMVAAGKSIRFLVPESVRDFIIKNNLYGNNEDP
jgi:nicotinate-nucleotide adenylyltransferase